MDKTKAADLFQYFIYSFNGDISINVNNNELNDSSLITAFYLYCQDIDNKNHPFDDYLQLINFKNKIEKQKSYHIFYTFEQIRNILRNNRWNYRYILGTENLKKLGKFVKRKVKKTRRLEASKYISKKHIRKIIFDKYDNCCHYCGSDESLEIDHVVPVSKGGKSNLQNLQSLCMNCNSKKGTKLENELDWINT